MRGTQLLFVILLASLVSACGGSGSGDAATADAQGARVYSANCAACHQADGSGIPGIYPPITQTEWIEGDSGRLIRLILYGMGGPIEVKGAPYNGVMPPHRHLSDDQIAAVLTFVRQNFGNEAGPVTPDDVYAVRAAIGRRGVWEPSELESATGIPDLDAAAR